MNKPATVEPQYAPMLARAASGTERLGLSTNYAWHDDPKRLSFTLARYKFVAKMLSGCPNALEVGCGDAFGTRIVQQEVKQLTAIDFDPVFIADVRARLVSEWQFECFVHNILNGCVYSSTVDGKFCAAYSLDVLEHIALKDEELFLQNIVTSLELHGVVIIGTPSKASQHLASPLSKAGHVNCKDGPELKTLLQKFFHNVFMFSMNDEVVHTGHQAMAQYLFAVCTGKRI